MILDICATFVHGLFFMIEHSTIAPPPTDPLLERSPPHGQSAAESPADWLARDAAEREARQLEGLAELATMALSLARTVHRQVEARQAVADEVSPEAVQALGSLGTAYARAARTLRQTWALENRIAEARRKRLLGIETARAEVAGKAAPTAYDAEAWAASGRNFTAMEAHAILDEMIEAEHDDDDTALRLHNEAYEHLMDAKDDEAFPDRPMGEIVASIAKALGLNPDWNAWRYEDWAEEDAEAKAWGSPYGRGFKPWRAGEGGGEALHETGPP